MLLALLGSGLFRQPTWPQQCPVPPRLLGLGVPAASGHPQLLSEQGGGPEPGAERCAPAGVCSPEDQPRPSAASALQALEGASQPPAQPAPQEQPWASQRSPALLV